jgi:hypothetical protein
VTAPRAWRGRLARTTGGVVALVARDRARVAAIAAQLGLTVVSIDLRGTRDAAGVLDRFAAALGFPASLGHDRDALDACLCDLAWLPARGYALIIEYAADDLELGGARPSLIRAARAWATRSVAFWALLVPSVVS